jgi:23S rRNA (cytidine2498-2'-O)-methyltransferase
MKTLLTLCRPGFEKECVAALADACARRGLAGFGRAEPETGYARFELQDASAIDVLAGLSLDELVFARDVFATGDAVAMAAPDRLAGLRAQLPRVPPLADVQTGSPDTNAGRELATLARQLGKPLQAALTQAGVRMAAGNRWRFLLLLTDGETCFPCVGAVAAAPPWPLGVPRLKLLREAPSRSALKLEEAWHLFIPRDAWATLLSASRTAVDLGAAPGGWTWLMSRRGMRVEAIDNGPLAAVLKDDPRITHLRADGFTFQPKRPVDWLVCDMVEKPSRVTALVARWCVRGWCKQAIFNLKLPMKQRYAQVQADLGRLQAELEAAGLRSELRARQLYHDREEITVYLRLLPSGGRPAGRGT